MAVNCSFCNQTTAKPVLCDKCSQLSCEKCAVLRNDKTFCVRCYMEGCNEKERKHITDILKERGVIKIDMAVELGYKGIPMVEISRTKSDGVDTYALKCKSQTGTQYFEITSGQFAELWEKTLKFGYKPERIPFGERIMIPQQAASKLKQ